MNILVTGASRGIGKVIAAELQSLGKVFVTARTETLTGFWLRKLLRRRFS